MSNIVSTAISTSSSQRSSMDEMIAQAPPEQRGFLEAQKKVQQDSQVMEMITNLMKKMDEMAKAAIGNLK
ncbi:hypothetical protein DRW03_01850 [Corallococcus sp. H22C18031201]|nr:hypothetical protein DRW03_01850 [Corallococcus sp. H22C18031201]